MFEGYSAEMSTKNNSTHGLTRSYMHRPGSESNSCPLDYQISLTPMGILSSNSAHARPSAQTLINVSLHLDSTNMSYFPLAQSYITV